MSFSTAVVEGGEANFPYFVVVAKSINNTNCKTAATAENVKVMFRCVDGRSSFRTNGVDSVEDGAGMRCGARDPCSDSYN